MAEGKKLRLVIDLCHVNAFVSKVKFKYEDLRSLSQVLEENHWFFTRKLQSGYHHFDIFADHQKYLGFSWIINDDGFTSQPDFISAMAASTFQRKELRLSSLVTHEEKSNWKPRQVGEWLGIIIDTIAMQYKVPEKKLAKLKIYSTG